MSALGVLGGRPRRGSTHGVLSGLGKLTSPTEWTIDKNEWPSTVSHAVVNSWTRWKELAYPGSGLKASSTAITPWKVGQVLTLPPSWVPQAAPSAPAAAAPAAAVPAVIQTPTGPAAVIPADPLAPSSPVAIVQTPAGPAAVQVAPSAPAQASMTGGMSTNTMLAIGAGAAALIGLVVLSRKKAA